MSSSLDLNNFDGVSVSSLLTNFGVGGPAGTSPTAIPGAASGIFPTSSVPQSLPPNIATSSAPSITSSLSLSQSSFSVSASSVSQTFSAASSASTATTTITSSSSSSSSSLSSLSSSISSTISSFSSSASSTSPIPTSSSSASPTNNPSPENQGVSSGSYNSNSMCDNTCIIAISTILGGVTLILLALGLAWFARRKLRERRAAAANFHPNHSAAAVGKEPMRDASIYPSVGGVTASAAAGGFGSKRRSADEESGYGFARRATDIANAVRAQLPPRLSSVGGLSEEERERGRERDRERVDRARYEGLASREGSRPEGERPSRGMGWAV